MEIFGKFNKEEKSIQNIFETCTAKARTNNMID